MVTIQYNEIDYDEINKAAMFGLAAKIAAQAKALCHVDEGLLRNSIMAQFQREDYGFNDRPGKPASEKIQVPIDMSAYVGTKTKYATYEEYGTKYRAPHPFLRPAILIYTGQKGAKEVKDMIDKEMKMGALKPGQKRVFD